VVFYASPALVASMTIKYVAPCFLYVL